MTKFKKLPEADTEEAEHFPLEPRYHPIHKIPRIAYDFLASAKLAMALLVAILICSLTGVTILRGQRAWELIFSTVWFNGILVLLVINVACCFFGRIWHRRITIISFGMILFHVSFVSILQESFITASFISEVISGSLKERSCLAVMSIVTTSMSMDASFLFPA